MKSRNLKMEVMLSRSVMPSVFQYLSAENQQTQSYTIYVGGLYLFANSLTN